ncbi:MAG: DUF1292 domain-containing protein [Clostridium sp.]|uniref:DUF1292 domain-containing protein n=1 Tax=Clostridium sp. TaxID=1506 RepID=UPI00305B4518
MGNKCCGHSEDKKETGCCGGHNHEEAHEGCCGGHNHEESHEGCCGGHNHEESHEGCCGGHDHEEEGCGCGCGEHESMFVELEDEEGNVTSCEIVDGFLFKENEYALVQNPDDGSIYLFKVVGDDEVGELVVPEDDEYDEARAYYEETIANETNEN